MADNHDSTEVSMPNGEEGGHNPDEESDGLPNSETSIHQEAGSGEIHHVESKEDMFVDATDDMQENQFHEMDNGAEDGASSMDELQALRALLDKTVGEKESIAKQYEEEKEALSMEVVNLRYRLKTLINGQLLTGNNGSQEEMVADASPRGMISECSQFVESALEERLQNESKIRDLCQQVEDLSMMVQVDQDLEFVMDRMLASIGGVVNLEELLDYSVTGKMSNVERSISLLVEQYRWILYEMDQLRQCLYEGGFNIVSQNELEFGSVFAAARGGLLELKKKEVEMVEKLNHLEDANRKLLDEVENEKAMAETINSELGKVKAELEQEKSRCANTKEKLSLAVTKGKALVQQRDSLKHSLAEKTSDLEKCLVELQEKTKALEAAELCKEELVKCENFASTLQETVAQRNTILGSFEEIFSQTSVPEELQSMDIIERLKWLVNFVAQLQEMLLQRNKNFDELEEIFSQISVPAELQSAKTVEKLKWLTEERNALKDNLLEFHRLKDALSLIDLPETASSYDLEMRIGWLKESLNQAKGEINMLQDEITRKKEAARNEIDRLSASLLTELQEKEYVKMELEDLASKYEVIVEEAHQASSKKDQLVTLLLDGSGIITEGVEGAYQTYSDLATLVDGCFGKIKEQSSNSLDASPAYAEAFERMQILLYVRDLELMLSWKLLEEDVLVRSEVSNLLSKIRLASQELAALKVEKDSLQNDLERSEEKSALLREKLSLAVKKGKGLVQDRENSKILLEEKNSEIETLKLELQQQESMVAGFRDQINKLCIDLEQIPKMEANLVAMKGEKDQLEQFLLHSNNMLQRVIESIDHIVLPVDSVFEEPVEKVNWLAEYLNECEQAKIQAEQVLGKFREDTSILDGKLAEARQTIKSLEDALLVAENHISQLAEEKREIEVGKKNAEQDLQKAVDEATSRTSKFTEACAIRKSLEDTLSLAENNISLLIKEREQVQLSRAAKETELEKAREEITIQTSKLTEAYRTISSLEDALSQAEVNVSFLTDQNNHVQVGKTSLENELMKLKDEAESQAGKLADASKTIKSLEDSLSKAVNNISVLEDEKKVAEREISAFNLKLNTCMNELAGRNGSFQRRSVELFHHLSDLQVLIKNESALSMVRQWFEKEFENLKNMDIILREITDHFVDTGSEMLQIHPVMEEGSLLTKPFPCDLGSTMNSEMDTVELNAAESENISLYFKRTAEGFQLQNKILADNFEVLSIFIDEFTEYLLRKLEATKDAVVITFEQMESLQHKMKNMEMHVARQEKTIATLESVNGVLIAACTNATRDLEVEVGNKLPELSSVPKLENLNHDQKVSEVVADATEDQQKPDDSNYVKMAEKLSLATRKVQTLTKLFERTSNVAAATIEDLQKELRETKAASEKAIEERGIIQNRVSELENDVEALKNSCNELQLKTGDYQAIEQKLMEKEEELSTFMMKEQEAEESLLSASQMKTLFDKISGLEISFSDSEVGDEGPHSSVDLKKLFYIVDIVTELQHQINVVSHDKDELQAALSRQIHEIECLKKEIDKHAIYKQDYEEMKSEISELTFGLEKIIDILGGNEIVGDQKSTGLNRLLPVVEKQITALHLDAENSKSQVHELNTKLLGSQKVADELSTRVKLLQDSLQSRTVQPEIVQERSMFEAPPRPTGSEISEIEDVGSVGKNAISPVSSAAQLRTMRKGSTDHLVLNIASESSSLINSEETDEDKGHVFKSLNTSGFIPKQGKAFADRIDGIWVSGGKVLMSRPRARLGLIVYCLFLHIWLLGTIL